MRAAVLVDIPSTDLRLEEVPDPAPGPGSVVISVEACGICGTDLHIMEGVSYRPSLPFIMGHEPVGVVTAVGSGVDKAMIGARVVPTLFVGCNKCEPCRSGDERLCEMGPSITGVTLPGGFAECVELLTTQLVRVPEDIAPVVAASLVDAGPTAHNAFRVALEKSMSGEGGYLVAGAGPIGLLIAELLRRNGSEVSMVESNAERQRAAQDRGFHVGRNLSELDGPFKSVIDCAASAGLVQQVLEQLLPHGVYVSVGYTRLQDFDLPLVSHKELVICGVRSGRRSDLEEILNLVANGSIVPAECEPSPLEDINRTLESLRAGKVRGKAVVVMGA